MTLEIQLGQTGASSSIRRAALALVRLRAIFNHRARVPDSSHRLVATARSGRGRRGVHWAQPRAQAQAGRSSYSRPGSVGLRDARAGGILRRGARSCHQQLGGVSHHSGHHYWHRIPRGGSHHPAVEWQSGDWAHHRRLDLVRRGLGRRRRGRTVAYHPLCARPRSGAFGDRWPVRACHGSPPPQSHPGFSEKLSGADPRPAFSNGFKRTG